MSWSPDLSADVCERIDVAAGILIDENDRILLTERIGDSPFAGLWEFPGGKLHSDETTEAAMRRELSEELGITVLRCEFLMAVQHRYADRFVAIDFFTVGEWQGEPTGRDGQALLWQHPRDIDVAGLLPADAPVLEALHGKVTKDSALQPARSGG
ncbi:MAG: 8-oxo-dGTP diphosphatase MutT [Woeseia sp.]|nr:8-oxo-dGTP diphosphatase MutT [Woeseia sp.]NNE61497.1 8-oxo-dGTP diphosphatase MutT [Woeseia sp.]NNL54480.1 8-oxo-dGTP diphosphatase MutT [Woeseia sp.]